MVMNEAVKMQNRETKAQSDSLPHSREYEIWPSDQAFDVKYKRETCHNTENGDYETPPDTADGVGRE